MGINLDFSGVEDGEFGEIKPGLYAGRVDSVEHKMGAKSGKPYLNFCFVLDDGNRKVFDNWSLQPQALWRIKKLMIALGWDADELAGNFDLNPKAMVGRPCVIHVGPPDQGSKYNKVEEVYDESHPIEEEDFATSTPIAEDDDVPF